MSEGVWTAVRQESSSAAEEPYRPEIFVSDSLSSVQGTIRRRSSTASTLVFDTLHFQLGELISSRRPKSKYSTNELEIAIKDHLGGRSLDEYGRWIYYPWSGELVHLLPPGEFHELRTNRNRYKLTAVQQETLSKKTIAIVGLSVGQATAITCVLEGVGGRFRLADFDTLSLSNLNRLRAKVTDIGLSKTVLAARQMFELNPYLDIEINSDGVNDANIQSFLNEGGKPDLIIEECDSLNIKVLVREVAKSLRIPVVMETSDRGMLDVERFDLEPERPIFHGLVGNLSSHSLKGLSTKAKVPFMLKLLNGMSPSLAGSLVEIEETISSFPQLGSAVTLGGAVATDTARRILLGQFTQSGRFFIDLDQLVSGDVLQQPPAPTVALTAAPDQADEGVSPSFCKARPEVLSKADITALVWNAVQAPSGGNSQPWRFVYKNDRLGCYLDASRTRAFLDFRQGASYLAIGAAIENLSLAASHLGFDLSLFPRSNDDDPLLVCAVEFVRNPDRRTPDLYRYITLRSTNRKKHRRTVFSETLIDGLKHSFESSSVRLSIVEQPEQLEALGNLIGETDRFLFQHDVLRQEMTSEIRWSPEAAARTRDGIDVETLEFDATDRAGFQLVSQSPVMRFLKEIGEGKSLESSAKKMVAASSAIGILSVAGSSSEDYFRGGRAFQRTWLTAAKLNLEMHPMTGLVYLLARFRQRDISAFSTQEVEWLASAEQRYFKLTAGPTGWTDVMLFRIGQGDPPSARSLRRNPQQVLQFE